MSRKERSVQRQQRLQLVESSTSPHVTNFVNSFIKPSDVYKRHAEKEIDDELPNLVKQEENIFAKQSKVVGNKNHYNKSKGGS